MEGIPRVPMIAPDLKIPDDPMPADWVPKLREYIFTHYNDDPSKFNEAFKELQSMRYHACRYNADVESICIMKRYYAQLLMIKSRFPMEPNEPVSVSFAWSDRSNDMAVGAAYEDINFELCCIMYNIGAAHATIAMNETRSDEDSCKKAFMHFQLAAWPFEYLRDKLGASKFASSNFEPELLTYFVQILSAQAHECLTEKSIYDNRANTIIAKLARHASETYFELKLRLDQDTLSDYILSSKLKTWKRLCESKAHFYEAIKRFYLGQQCSEEEKHGESVAHLAAALEHIKEAQKIINKDKKESESMKQAISFAYDVISQKEAKIRKENDFVYHDRVPKAEDLTQVDAVTKVQLLSFDPCDRSVSGDDLFAALLPANVLKGVSLYCEEKAKLKRELIKRIEKKDTELEQHLLSLQLNQLNLDQSIDEMRLPEELLQASAAFTAQPHAFSELIDKLNAVATKSSEAEIKLTDLKHRLLNVKCPQLEEDEGYKVISSKVDELMDHHIQARANNTELQKALASQSEQLKLLALPLTELANNICDKVVNVNEMPEGKKLREMIEKVEEMKKGRIYFFNNFTKDLENDDITSKVLAEKDFNTDALFQRELKKHEKAIHMIDMNLDAQEKILTALTEANANFAECRRDIVENNEKRRSQSIALITAYQVFAGVKEKTEAAATFYDQLFALIRALDKSVSGMEDTFKGERERHEEQKRIVAERTKLYRERTSMETNEQPFRETSERRRPRLGDMMEYYRSKLAAGSQQQQSQSPFNGSQQNNVSTSNDDPYSNQVLQQPQQMYTTTSQIPTKPTQTRYSSQVSSPLNAAMPSEGKNSRVDHYSQQTQHSTPTSFYSSMPPNNYSPYSQQGATLLNSAHNIETSNSGQYFDQNPQQQQSSFMTSSQMPSVAQMSSKPQTPSMPQQTEISASSPYHQNQRQHSSPVVSQIPSLLSVTTPSSFTSQTSSPFNGALSQQNTNLNSNRNQYSNQNMQQQSFVPPASQMPTSNTSFPYNPQAPFNGPLNQDTSVTNYNQYLNQSQHSLNSMPTVSHMSSTTSSPQTPQISSSFNGSLIQQTGTSISNRNQYSNQNPQRQGTIMNDFQMPSVAPSSYMSQPSFNNPLNQQTGTSVSNFNSNQNAQQQNSFPFDTQISSVVPPTPQILSAFNGPKQPEISASNYSQYSNSIQQQKKSVPADSQTPSAAQSSHMTQFDGTLVKQTGTSLSNSGQYIISNASHMSSMPSVAHSPYTPSTPFNGHQQQIDYSFLNNQSQQRSFISQDPTQPTLTSQVSSPFNGIQKFETSVSNNDNQKLQKQKTIPTASQMSASIPLTTTSSHYAPQVSSPFNGPQQSGSSISNQPNQKMQQQPPQQPVTAASQMPSITPSPYANLYKKPTQTSTSDSPWHRSLPTQKPVSQTNYVSPFAPQKPASNQPAAPSPFQPIHPAHPQSATYFNSGQNNFNGTNSTERPRDITTDLLNDLFATSKAPMNFPKQGSNNVGNVNQPTLEPSMQGRPAATVLPFSQRNQNL